MNCRIYEVGHDGFHWRLSQRHSHLSVPYLFKESAVFAARQLALACPPAQVVIRAPGGQIETEWSFARERSAREPQRTDCQVA
jgi:hypothetical protein